MRQVLIPETNDIRDQVGTVLAFKLGKEDKGISNESPTEVEFNLPKINAGLIFKLPYPLAQRGIVLLSAAAEDGKIRALYGTINAASHLFPGEVVLEVTLVEEVKYVQVNTYTDNKTYIHPNGVAIFEPGSTFGNYTTTEHTPKKRRKSNKA